MPDPTLVARGPLQTQTGADVPRLQNFIGGRWVQSTAARLARRPQPGASARSSRSTPLSTGRDVDAAVTAAPQAFPGWSETPPVVRARDDVQASRQLLEEHFEEIARIVTTEHGKTLDEARGSVRRGIECVEVACGAPVAAHGLRPREHRAAASTAPSMRQPIGVCAAIAPFNFPAMVPLWFLPFAVVVRQHVHPQAVRAGAALAAADVRAARAVRPAAGRRQPGQRRQGGRRGDLRSSRASAPCRSSARRRWRGSSTSARTHAGKRVQALGGAKNFIVVMPDADLERSIPIITESFYGCAGERCLAGSVLLPVGDAHKPARDRLVEAARALKVGDGLEPGVDDGPGDQRAAPRAVLGYVDKGVSGRRQARARRPRASRSTDRAEGFFVGPTRLRRRVAGDGRSAARRSSGRSRRSARVQEPRRGDSR